MTLLAEELPSPAPEAARCQRCGYQPLECLCDLRRPSRQPAAAAALQRPRKPGFSASLDAEITKIRDVVVTKSADGKPLCECGSELVGACFQCEPCARRSQEARKQRELTLRLDAWRDEIRGWAPLTGVPDWEWARLDNPDFTQRIRFPRLLAYAQRYQPSHGGVLLSTDTGNGKTSLTRAALHRLRDDEVARILASRPGTRPSATLWTLRDLVWTTGFDLAKARRENSLGDGEARLVERAIACKVLVIDEVGFEVLHDTTFQEVINARYAASRQATIVTTGLEPAAFGKRYGDATLRKLVEHGILVEAW